MEELIKRDIKEALVNHYGYGKESVEQFMELEAESLVNYFYDMLSAELVTRTNRYEKLIGDINL